MNYVFLKTKVYEKENNIQIECIKTNNKFEKIDIFKYKINKNKKQLINNLINFLKGNRIIGFDLSKVLIYILDTMYKFQIYDLSFKYFDIKDCEINISGFNTIDDMIEFMRNYSDSNLNNIKYQKKNTFELLKVFRGLNYKIYPLKHGYYIYDKSINKYVSYYVHKKELLKDDKYTLEEYFNLKDKGGKFITNFEKLSNETLKLTNEYTLYSGCNLNKYQNIIKAIKKSLDFLDEHPNITINLICIGTINELKENYKVLGREKINKILSLITIEKDLWSKW